MRPGAASFAILAGCGAGSEFATAPDRAIHDAGADARADGAGAPGLDFGAWPDGPPAAECAAGRYAGTYEGTVTVSLFGGPTDFVTTGSMEVTLAKVGSGEFFEITGGTVEGKANGMYPYSAELEGRLNCATRALEDGRMTNGSVTVAGATYGFEGEPGSFAAGYEPDAPAFVDGTWAVTQSSGPPVMGSGAGTWAAAYAP